MLNRCLACLSDAIPAVTLAESKEESAAVPVAPSELAGSFVPLEPCPCEGCRLVLRCKPDHLACVAFSLFMAGKSAVRWRIAPRVPTRERYEGLLGAHDCPSA
jgi:hypothetical protein